jgi:hypothetical protein
MPHWDQIVADPQVTIGHYKVLQRTDGVYIAYDVTAPFGKQLVGLFRTCENATKWLELRTGMKKL